ncbi:phytoene desaturase family protein [Salibacter sp.]|uniref:phytoene desaturase family protein n=1 Tax=Salibacter sp. TaxID=2010995 RepID=UPI0028701A75|nr:phytoene desaturase family protein [Salibacter sp.]MDR9397668.1 phytoene desaturase family protein [Salibacter sp.]MDR9486822.1 phytoene desaturase family protein [Salibacter sp.]
MNKKVIVIGAGFAGLSSAACLAKDGYDVTILEKNESVGGRARQFKAAGFTFDMGPSWYWMPDVFENFYNKFGYTTSDLYDLQRLDPAYKVHFGENDHVDIPANFDELVDLFESIEQGSGQNLKKFLDQAEYKYQVGINDLVYKPSKSLTEFFDWRIVSGVFKMDLFKSISSEIRKLFKNPKLIELLEFPVLFLGAKPQNTPALYSLMNYADLKLGTWYPKGGMHKIVEAMEKIAREQGVKIETGVEIDRFEYNNGTITSAISGSDRYDADAFVGAGDYHHIEQKLVDKKYRNYSEDYWDKRTMAPSSLLFYIGVDKKLKNLNHHNLFFDEDFTVHAQEIYDDPKWPSKPLFYVCAPSITDETVAPKGKENLFILIPTAPDLEDTEEMRERYYKIVMDRLEKLTKQKIDESVVYKKSYAHKDFKNDYHAFKGNAYGLANTLKQTAILKPSMHSKKLKNLLFTGQLTVPGPGVPPSLISGQVVAKEVAKSLKQ